MMMSCRCVMVLCRMYLRFLWIVGEVMVLYLFSISIMGCVWLFSWVVSVVRKLWLILFVFVGGLMLLLSCMLYCCSVLWM